MVGIRLDDADFRGTIGANGNVACVMDAKQSQHEHSGAHGVILLPNTQSQRRAVPDAPHASLGTLVGPVMPHL